MGNSQFDSDTNKVPIPIYFKLQTTLLREIENGRWKPGMKIPTEKDLSVAHQMSIGTARKAISNLVNDGYLYRLQGKGTYVAGKTLRDEELVCPYYHFRKGLMDQEPKMTVTFLDLKIVDNFEPASRLLNLKPDQRLFELSRIYHLDDKPIAYNVCYLPQKMFRNLEQNPASIFEEIPLCNILEKNYGKPALDKHELFGATLANAEIASILEIKEGTPLLFIEMLTFTYKKTPFEYRTSYCLTTAKKVFRMT